MGESALAAIGRGGRNHDRTRAGTADSHYRVAVFGGVAQYVDTVSA
ncbi:hypothetical protein HF908_26255 (plasmid) [Ralstonia pseudosolanacearum]|nr:hypothetical protein [Ralstonia pseudosolanacearum]QOK93506.1 hypothetical protein HF908_26255 [Ralstonia pseudosolanacearum]